MLELSSKYVNLGMKIKNTAKFVPSVLYDYKKDHQVEILIHDFKLLGLKLIQIITADESWCSGYITQKQSNYQAIKWRHYCHSIKR